MPDFDSRYPEDAQDETPETVAIEPPPQSPEIESPTVDSPIQLTARQFAKSTGEKSHRTAGFLSMCHGTFSNGKKTIEEWRKIWDAFWSTKMK